MRNPKEAMKAIDKLDAPSLRAVLRTLLANPESKVEGEVLSRLSFLQFKDVDVDKYGSESHKAIKNGNYDALNKLISRADKLAPENSIQALARIAGVLSHSQLELDDFDEQIVDTGVLKDLSGKINKQMKDIDWIKVPADTVDQMKRVVSRFYLFQIDYFDSCLQRMEEGKGTRVRNKRKRADKSPLVVRLDWTDL
jgi:hypothetical protein